MRTRPSPLRASLIALALMLLTLLTACGGGETTDEAHNDADVAFAQQMVPHHRQAVAMAEMVAARDDVGPGVIDLARRIEKAQGPEIRTMTGWLTAWGAGPGASTHGGSMPGMMSGADMEALDAAQGKAFARQWLRDMIRHHTGAVAMARTEQDRGRNADARDLAGSIEKSQTSEIAEMKQLLAGG